MKKIIFALLGFVITSVAKAQAPSADGVCGICKHPITAVFEETHQQHAARAKAIEDWNPEYIIDFLAAFDPNAVEWAMNKCGSLEAYAEHIVENMNFVMHNSELNGKFRLVGTYEVLDNVMNITQGPSYIYNNVNLGAELKRTKADVCLLFSGKQDSGNPIAGNAFYNASPGMGLGCVTVDGAYDTMTAIHEVGHIMGCAHARDVDLDNQHPYNAGAMRWIDGQQYSTVMGYHGTLLPHFSSPNYIYKGTAMGSESEDCCRRITERLPEVAHLGDPTYEYTVSENPKVVSNAQQYVTVNVHTYTNFSVTTNDTWIQLNENAIYTDMESYDAKIDFRVDANYSNSPREGRITIMPWDDGYEPYDIIVRQYCQNGIFVDPASIKTDGHAQEVQLTITAESSTFNFIIPEDESISWLTIRNENRSGNGSRNVPIQLTANTSGQTRSCNVIAYGGNINGPSVKVNISQAPSDFGFETTTTALNVDSRETNTRIDIFAGHAFTAEADEWIHVEKIGETGECTLNVTIAANTSDKQRQGNIHLATTDKKFTLDIPVTQSGTAVFNVSENSWNPDCRQQSKTIHLEASTDWEVSIEDGAWLTASPAKGTGSKDICFTVTLNEGAKPRWNKATISAGPSVSPLVISIEQGSYDATLPPLPEGGKDEGDNDGDLYTISSAKYPDLFFTTNFDGSTYTLSSTAEKFIITPTDGGYTIVSENGKKVGISTVKNWYFADAEAVWKIEDIEGNETTILQARDNIGFGADNYAAGSRVYTNKDTSHKWIVKKSEGGDTGTVLYDITNDRRITKEDVEALGTIVIEQVTATKNPNNYNLKATDVNKDGKLTIGDITTLINILFKL